MIIRKTFLTTKEDVFLFYKATLLKTNSVLTFIVSVLMMLYITNRIVGHLGGTTVIFAFIGSVGLIIAAIIFNLHNNAKKFLEQNVFFQHNISVELSEEGFRQETYSSNLFLKWSDAYNYIESKKTFAIFTSQQQAYIVPKRIFHDYEIEEISELLKDNVKLSKDNIKSQRPFSSLIIYIIIFIILIVAVFLLALPK